ncbi:MAG TPA: hypothetical protein VHP83_22560 [Aggregatilineaceae bacterium]|nr:hypothetical protein [Aggregatilineaceae bacterium]
MAWGLYATIAVSIVALLTSMIILARELLGSDLDATLNSHPLDVQIHYPSDWSMAQAATPILDGPTANMAILSDQAVPPDGPYDSAKLVIAVQQVDPLAMFKMPLRCQIEIRSGPAAAFDCMRKSGYITPKYNAFTSDHFEGAVKLPGKYPPTPAARPMVLLPLNQDTWIAVLVLHTDGYDQPDDMLNAIAQAIQPLP